jgi:hypothetical protein
VPTSDFVKQSHYVDDMPSNGNSSPNVAAASSVTDNGPFAARATTERRLDMAKSRYVLALAEALPRSPDTVALLLRS